MNMKQILAAIALSALAMTAAALPTVDEVQAEVGRGNYAHAETMMQEVVTAKPGSARAHYVYGEILAHNKRFAEAATEVARAKAIDPTIGFADAAKFRTFEQLLEREQRQVKPTPALSTPVAPEVRQQAPVQSSGVPSWVWMLGLAGVGFVAWTIFSRRRQVASSPMGMAAVGPGSAVAAGPAGYGSGPGYGQAPGGAGSGMLGVGLAAAGGVAAGMLASRLLDGHHDSAAGAPSAPAAGGLVPGMFDDAPADNGAARELEQRDVDFGVGDGWGGGDGGSDPGSDGW